jgi:uracil-DNA glycosylase
MPEQSTDTIHSTVTTATTEKSALDTVTTEKTASELVSSLTEASWKDALSETIGSESFLKLASFLQEERASGATIYPPQDEIFNALNLCPFDQVKVVIVGQDPYHGPGQGHGLAFSVRKGVKAPPSLQNVFREATEDVGIEAPEHGNLEHWAKQGVLLLNTVLTVRRGEANSHAKRGWEDFTDRVIQELNDQHEGLVFLLWGSPAAKKASGVDTSKHTVIRTSHPSPLGATKTASPFLGSKCFSRTNAALNKMGKDPIDWNVE